MARHADRDPGFQHQMLALLQEVTIGRWSAVVSGVSAVCRKGPK
ncbi:hypothetical protein [Streptomyces lavenduligriseus]|nr:hypothetical protein [Streptomyces lavenduligriseus]